MTGNLPGRVRGIRAVTLAGLVAMLLATSACQRGDQEPSLTGALEPAEYATQSSHQIKVGDDSTWGPVILKNTSDRPVTVEAIQPRIGGSDPDAVTIRVVELYPVEPQLIGTVLGSGSEFVPLSRRTPVAGFRLAAAPEKPTETAVAITIRAQALGTWRIDDLVVTYRQDGKLSRQVLRYSFGVCVMTDPDSDSSTCEPGEPPWWRHVKEP